MPEIAIGRKEIMKVLGCATWRTVQEWKQKDAGFRKLFRVHPITKKPILVVSEVMKWMIEYNK